MDIHTVYFDGAGKTRTNFSRLRDVFVRSVRRHMPDARLHVHTIPPCEIGKQYGLTSNSYKLAKWVEIADAIDDDTMICDCDIMFCGRVDCAFDTEFDLAYCKRSGPLPFNCGVVFLRPTETAKSVMRSWLNINDTMYKNAAFHRLFANKYAGMNQAAWGYLRDMGKLPAGVVQIDAKYNCCDFEWATEQDPRVYHIKSDLRNACLGLPHVRPKSQYAKIVNMFRSYEKSEVDLGSVPQA